MSDSTLEMPSCSRCGCLIHGAQTWEGGNGPFHPVCPIAVAGHIQSFPVPVDQFGIPFQFEAKDDEISRLKERVTQLEAAIMYVMDVLMAESNARVLDQSSSEEK